jgi:hypothetical protein
MTEPEQKLTPTQPDDLADTLSFALRHEGRKSQHDSDKLNADIVAQRLVRYVDKAGYVVMKKPPLGATLRLRGGSVSATSRYSTSLCCGKSPGGSFPPQRACAWPSRSR